MSEEKFDFTSLYGATNFPNLKILVDVAKEQLEKGIPMETVLQESLEFAVSEAISHHTNLVVNANKQVSEGLRYLKLYGAWPNLKAAAEHALELAEDLLRGGYNSKDITELTALRRKVLKTSISELSNVFKEEWIEKNFPLLKQGKVGKDSYEEDCMGRDCEEDCIGRDCSSFGTTACPS